MSDISGLIEVFFKCPSRLDSEGKTVPAMENSITMAHNPHKDDLVFPCFDEDPEGIYKVHHLTWFPFEGALTLFVWVGPA
jgi:hypothetical protein